MARRKATAPAEPTQLPIDTRWVPIGTVTPNPANIRHDLGDLTELAASIAEHGVLQPLVVHTADTDDTFMVIMGHRRLAAATAAAVVDVPILVRPTPSPGELAELMLAENLQRENLDPIDEALALIEVKRGGRRTVRQIAERVNRSVSWVAGRLALVKLPESLWDDVRTGRLPVNDAVALAQAPIDDDTRVRLAKSSSAARSWELDQAVKAAKKAAGIAKAAKAYPHATVADQHPEAYNSPVVELLGPLGPALYGAEPGQINTPPELCGHDHMYVQVLADGTARAWNLRPELLPAELVVSDPDTELEDGTVLWTDVDLDGVARVVDLDDAVALAADIARWDMVKVHRHCPNHRQVAAPWCRGGTVEVCLAPTVHDEASWRALAEQHATAPASQPARHRQPMPFEGPEGDALQTLLAGLVAQVPEGLARALMAVDSYDTPPLDCEAFADRVAAEIRGIVDAYADQLVDDGPYGMDVGDLGLVRWAVGELTAAGGDVPAGVMEALQGAESAPDGESGEEEAGPENGDGEAATAD